MANTKPKFRCPFCGLWLWPSVLQKLLPDMDLAEVTPAGRKGFLHQALPAAELAQRPESRRALLVIGRAVLERLDAAREKLFAFLGELDE